MFCPKCGTKAVEGAVFCQKCGAKLITDSTAHSKAPSASIGPMQYPNDIPGNTWKPRKSPIIPAVVVLAALIVILALFSSGQSGDDSAGNAVPSNDNESHRGVSFSEEVSYRDVSYKNVLLVDLLGMQKEKVYNQFGSPVFGTPVTGELLYGGTEYFGYDDISFEIDSGVISAIRVASGVSEVNGITLDKTRSEIVEMLGPPSYEEDSHDESGDFRDCYFMQYVDGGNAIVLRIEFPDSNSSADTVRLYCYADGPAGENYQEPLPELDYALCGRWRSYDGGYVEFSENGNASVSFKANTESFKEPFQITWESSNGQLFLTSYFNDTPEWSIEGKRLFLTYPVAGFQRIYSREEENTSIIGSWTYIGETLLGSNANVSDSLVLLADGTGSIKRTTDNFNRVTCPLVWQTTGTSIYLEWSQRMVYDYTVHGNVLTIFFRNGSETFTKVGN